MSAVAMTPSANGNVSDAAIRAGARNLLADYMKIKPGVELLIVNETSIERHTVEVLEHEARSLGARVLTMWCDRIPGPEVLPGSLVKAFEAAETTLFNHPVGGMLRLLPIGGTGLKCFSFANTDAILGSPFCRVPYATSAEILRTVQQRLNSARKWRVTCPAGTDLTGELTPEELAPSSNSYGGFTLLTFPLGIHKPFSTFAASGRLAIRWLTPAGIHEFDPAGIRLDSPVVADLDRGKLTGFSGDNAQISKLKGYLDMIGRKVDKDPYIVNSWHAGINPLAFSPCRDVDSLERWMFLAHANPRMVHFHAVGEVQPGEMSVPLLDPTISMDGEVIWDRGRLVFLEREDIKAALSALPAVTEALTQNLEVGV
ncbi:MAG: hypothetical protein IVW54_12645 [Candidatus Binataceae bacterium]|nr:hypothetical protein [Candidatus Binataceae bacterium]